MYNLSDFKSQKFQQIRGMAGDNGLYKQALATATTFAFESSNYWYH